MPDVIGRYAVRRLLGSGGFALVWLAYDDRLDDEVAIKVLADNWSNQADFRDRFDREARALRRVHSQNVVKVFDIDELPDGRPYFVMSYADQGSLTDRLRERTMPVATVLRHGARIADAVQDLHDAGLMHRDIKPSNVLFRSERDGSSTLLIADLGLVRDLEHASRFTVAGGTPGYMAPEQGLVDAAVDHRADVHGIGATVYHALTGQPPAAGAETVVPPSVLRPALPDDTDAVITRALARDPDRRWQSARALAAELYRLSDLAARLHPEPGPKIQERPATEPTAASPTNIVPTVQLLRYQPIHPAAPAERVTGPTATRTRRRGRLTMAIVAAVLGSAMTALALTADGSDHPPATADETPVTRVPRRTGDTQPTTSPPVTIRLPVDQPVRSASTVMGQPRSTSTPPDSTPREFRAFVNDYTGDCLQAGQTEVQLGGCGANAAQTWAWMEGYGQDVVKIQNGETGTCLDYSEVPDSPSTVVHSTCRETADSQLWRRTKIANADGRELWLISHLQSSKCLEAWRSGRRPTTEPYAGVWVAECEGSHEQMLFRVSA